MELSSSDEEKKSQISAKRNELWIGKKILFSLVDKIIASNLLCKISEKKTRVGFPGKSD
jgi:hypothetical protein